MEGKGKGGREDARVGSRGGGEAGARGLAGGLKCEGDG